jgi:hypothetical protein
MSPPAQRRQSPPEKLRPRQANDASGSVLPQQNST